MLCSASTGKSGHGWLDRLRTARGFPVSEEADLRDFLQNPNRPATDQPQPKPNTHQIGVLPRDEDENLFDIMSGVLNELFNFGDKCSDSADFKKSARKQTNPKICASSSKRSRDNNNGTSEKPKLWRSGDSSSGVEEVKAMDGFENKEEGVDKDGTLAGFSRTDVTVIDTSYEGWKFEKFLYRKENVWKVREKKGKSEIVMNRKRKLSEGIGKNQQKGKKLKDGMEKRGTECEMDPSSELHKPEAHEKEPDKVGMTLNNEHGEHCDSILENRTSSAILVKSSHTIKRKRSDISKSFLKSK